MCGPVSRDAFQKPNAQWALNEAMLHRMPFYSKCGNPQLIVSSTSGQAACTNSHMRLSIGLANSCNFSMYASMRVSFFPMVTDPSGSVYRLSPLGLSTGNLPFILSNSAPLSSLSDHLATSSRSTGLLCATRTACSKHCMSFQ